MRTILLVDDEINLRTVYAMVLRKNGYNVIEADSGLQGLKMAREHLPDLILSDIHMPGGDGSTLLQDIRREPNLKTKQVVLMTGNPDLMTPRKGMEAGADDFLVKPITLDSLLSCVKARLRRASINWRVEDHTLEQLRSSVPSQMPHEFFTPLAGIIGLTDILQLDRSTFAPEEIDEMLADINQSALRLHHTLRNYLLILELQTMSPESGLVSLQPQQVKAAISAGISETQRVNKRQADLFVEADPGPISIKAEHLTLIVEELVDNAYKFSRPGTPIKVKMETKGRLTIQDEGRGMTPDEIDRIGAFQQFERKKQEQQGLGLGLILVVKLAALYSAKFAINSQPGKGTEVEICFPSEDDPIARKS